MTQGSASILDACETDVSSGDRNLFRNLISMSTTTEELVSKSRGNYSLRARSHLYNIAVRSGDLPG